MPAGTVYRELGNEIPEDALQRLSATQAIVSIYITFLHSTSRIHLSIQVENISYIFIPVLHILQEILLQL